MEAGSSQNARGPTRGRPGRLSPPACIWAISCTSPSLDTKGWGMRHQQPLKSSFQCQTKLQAGLQLAGSYHSHSKASPSCCAPPARCLHSKAALIRTQNSPEQGNTLPLQQTGISICREIKICFFSSIRVQKIEIRTGRCFAFKQRIN